MAIRTNLGLPVLLISYDPSDMLVYCKYLVGTGPRRKWIRSVLHINELTADGGLEEIMKNLQRLQQLEEENQDA